MVVFLSCSTSCDGHLDLSSGDVTSEQAAVLGSLLSASTAVTQLCLNDCLLSEESVKVGQLAVISQPLCSVQLHPCGRHEIH